MGFLDSVSNFLGTSGSGGGVLGAIESVGQTVVNVVDSVIKNPLPLIETLALTAAVVLTAGALAPEAAPLEAGVLTGESTGLTSGAVDAALSSGSIDALGTGVALPAVSTASPLGGLAGMTANAIGDTGLVAANSSVATSLGLGAQSAVVAAAKNALNGASIDQIAKAALTAGVSSALTAGINSGYSADLSTAFGSQDLGNIAASALGGATGAAAAAAITGQSIGQAALSGGLTAGVSSSIVNSGISSLLGKTGTTILAATGAAATGAALAGKNAKDAAILSAINTSLSSSLSTFMPTQQAIQQALNSNPSLASTYSTFTNAQNTIASLPSDIAQQAKNIDTVSNFFTQTGAAIQEIQNGNPQGNADLNAAVNNAPLVVQALGGNSSPYASYINSIYEAAGNPGGTNPTTPNLNII